MWWLQRLDLANRTCATAAKLGTYPQSATTWVTDGVQDARPPLASRLRCRSWMKQPETIPVGLSSKGLRKAKKSKIKKQQAGFPVPSSWKSSSPRSQEKREMMPEPPKEQISIGKRHFIEERLRILKQQEGFVPLKKESSKACGFPKIMCNGPKLYAAAKHKDLPIFHSETDTTKTIKEEREVSEWICKSLEAKKAIGRLEGCRQSFSSIGKRLILKSKARNLWHEEGSQSGGRPAKTVFLGSLRPAFTTFVSDQTQWYRPICQLMRESVFFNLRTSPRIAPENQSNELEKGGHIGARNMLHDYKLRIQALRRQKTSSLDKEEARMLLCKGILNDNAQEYTKALRSYQGYLDLCKKIGDKQGESLAYNFIGCSIQEDQDLKLAREQKENSKKEIQIPTTAVIQYEKAEEYHKMHAETANLEGKFIAYTNLGLLYATVGKSKAAAISHQKALKCATLLERPEDQGVAVGNLGFLLFCQRQWGIAKLCTTRYLRICMAFKDIRGLTRAHYILGSIAIELNRQEEAVKEFKAALRAARLAKDHQMETLAKIMIGIAEGNVLYEKQIGNCSR